MLAVCRLYKIFYTCLNLVLTREKELDPVSNFVKFFLHYVLDIRLDVCNNPNSPKSPKSPLNEHSII